MTDRITFFNAWVGDQQLESFSAPIENSEIPITLPMVNLPYFENYLSSTPIELVHVDTQGAELKVIKSMRSLVDKGLLRFVMISTHHSSISGSANIHFDCIEELRSLGAIILVEHDVVESYSGDGLILASFYRGDQNLRFPEISRNKAETSLFQDF